MKKYKTNKAKKLLLASLVVPMAVSVLPAEIVKASEIPNLKVYDLNGSPKLEWATEILQENILTKINFDEGNLPSLKYYNQFDSLHSITNLGGYTGNGYLLNDNSNGKGNYFNFPQTVSDKHLSNYGKFYFENNIPLSMTFKAKSVGTSVISPWGNGGYANSIKQLNNKLTKDYKSGESIIYLDSLEGLNVGYEITSDTDPYNIREIKQIIAMDKENKSITLSNPFLTSMHTGESLKVREWRYVFDFNSRTISDKNWETYSINTFVSNHTDYDVLTRGAILYITAQTNGQLMIDDLTFGHATEVEVFRDGDSIYKGYLSDFHDKTIKDNMKPNKVSTVNGSITNDFNVNLNITKPEDNGTIANYQIQSISKSGTRSALSSPQEIEMKTGVVKYKYSINNQKTGIPTTKTSSLDEISVSLKSINLETDYLHIQAIDANGNESDVQSFKAADIIDTSNLQELYDKLKDVENNNNYNDFIDFIDEIEGLYGDNIPQDLKDRLEQLAKHHGVNTAFLLLEEGDFRLSTKDINSFGEVKLTAAKQTVTTSFTDDFGVIDARGTQEGWHVSVSATPFTIETFEGFVGVPHQLPVGSLALNAINHIEQVGTVHNSQLPNITLNQLSVIDGQNTTINLLNADKHKGMGEFKFNFGTDALALTVDAITAKIDSVNYPNQNTPYASTVTWDLVSGPQI